MTRLRRFIKASFLAVLLVAWPAQGFAVKNLVYCTEASPEGFDPGLYSAAVTYDASSQPVYNRLVEFERGTTKLVPALATDWQISDDNLEYTFHLRKGVKFQTTRFFTPTREFNADDVIFSFERQWKKDNPWYNYLAGADWLYFNSMELGGLLKSVEKVDDYTVKVTLTRPEAPFLADLAMDFMSIMSKEYADHLQKTGQMGLLNQQPLGTGPFIFENYQKDAVIRFRANPDYFRGKQPLDNLIFAITLDTSVRTQKLKAGECQVVAQPAFNDISEMRANPRFKVLDQAGVNIAYLAYNTEEPPFNKVEVRRALNMAINKQAIIDAVYFGSGIPAKSPLPPTVWGYDDDLPADVYDPEKAKQMLADAGVHNLKMQLWAMPIATQSMPNGRRAAELIQADLRKIGVESEIISMEWGEYLRAAKAKGRDGAAIMVWTGDNGDPDNFLGTLTSCGAIDTNNYARWCDPEFDALTAKAKATSNHEERVKLYKQAQRMFREKAPWLLIAHSTVFAVMSDKVKGYLINPVGARRFDGVDLEQ